MKPLLKQLAITFLCVFTTACTPLDKISLFDSPESTEEGPLNIVLIVSDDQRADSIERMPTVMDLAKDGLFFTHAYVTTPLCCPSRCSILTGQYAHNHHVYTNRDPDGGFTVFEDSSTLATWLQDEGYKTGLIGKYLNGYNPGTSSYIPPGWDWFMAFVKGPNYYNYTLKNFIDGKDGEILKYGEEKEDYSTDVLAQHAVDFLNSTESKDEQPFFLYFTPYAPHNPATPPERYKDLPLDSTFDPLSYNETEMTDKPEWLQETKSLNSRLEQSIVDYRQKEQGALLALDDAVKGLMETLEANGELENTLILYMGDNGLQWGEHRIVLEKSVPYEESVKVPLVAYLGGQTLGQSVDDFVLNIDLAPTIMEWAGFSTPESVDGKSFLSLLLGDNYTPRADFLTESWGMEIPGFTSLHQDEWVYTLWETGEEELYNLEEDPYELDNVVEESTHADQLKSMRERLKELQGCQGQEACS